MTRRAADLLVDCLVAHGVDRVFCVPGESYLAVLDALVGKGGEVEQVIGHVVSGCRREVLIANSCSSTAQRLG